MCFRFFSLYHSAVSCRVKELAAEDLEANEIVSLLTWVLNTYKRYKFMQSPVCVKCLFRDSDMSKIVLYPLALTHMHTYRIGHLLYKLQNGSSKTNGWNYRVFVHLLYTVNGYLAWPYVLGHWNSCVYICMFLFQWGDDGSPRASFRVRHQPAGASAA